jgi:hypothetical protein
LSLSHFSCPSVFWPYSRSYNVQFSCSTIFSFSHHIPGPNVCIFHFHVSHYFLSYSRSYTVIFAFSIFFSFLDKIQVL